MPRDRRFVIGLLVAFLPAAVIGAAAGSYIKAYLFNPWVVCFSLIVGGAILLWVDSSISSRMSTTPRPFRCRCISASGSRSAWR